MKSILAIAALAALSVTTSAFGAELKLAAPAPALSAAAVPVYDFDRPCDLSQLGGPGDYGQCYSCGGPQDDLGVIVDAAASGAKPHLSLCLCRLGTDPSLVDDCKRQAGGDEDALCFSYFTTEVDPVTGNERTYQVTNCASGL